MADYKLMPEEATPEMLAAGEYALEAGCYVSGIYADMHAAAPVVRDDSALQACITYIVHGDADFTGMDEGLVGYFKEKVGEMSPSGDVQGEPVTWSGWGCQYPGKMPRLYGDRRIAELNCDWENGDQVLHFTATPQPDVTQLVEALEYVMVYHEEVGDDDGNLLMHHSKMMRKVKEALATYRKGVKT